MKVHVRADMLIIDLDTPRRCLSSAVFGGGLGWVRTWLNLQVPSGYARTDPEEHLREVSADLAGPVVGMLTAAPVDRFTEGRSGGAIAVATVGVRHALAAASERPRPVPRVGTINLFILTLEPLTDAGLVGALQTAVEAKAQALAKARVPAVNAPGFATGTATDSIVIACPAAGCVPFAGPATQAGGDIARAVHRAVLAGVLAERSTHQEVSL